MTKMFAHTAAFKAAAFVAAFALFTPLALAALAQASQIVA